MIIKHSLFAITLLGTTIINAMNTEKKEMITISVECNEKLKMIRHDAASLKYFCEGVFSATARTNNPKHKPSDLINWLQEDPNATSTLQLKFISASKYIQFFIKEKNDEFDTVFAEKYKETQDLGQTWNWFNNHFAENGLRKPISKYMQRMVKADVEKLEWEKKGITFSHNGKTAFIDLSQAERHFSNKE